MLWLVIPAQSQNLIPNGDFEEYTSLPTQWSEIELATGWIRTSGSPDYNHESGFNIGHRLQPYSGLGQAGFFTYYKASNTNNKREYLGIQLIEPLAKGEKYRLQFYITNGKKLNSLAFHITTNNIGANFSILPLNQPPGNGGHDVILLEPQIEYTEMLESYNDWTLLSFVFTAQDTFHYVTFGNFHDDLHTLLNNPTLNSEAYYFIDKIELVQMDYSICRGQSITLEHFSRDSIFKWVEADDPNVSISNQKTLTVSPEFNTTYLLFTDGDTIEFPINVDLPLKQVFPSNTSICFDQPILLEAQKTNATNIYWQDGSTNPTFLITQPGTYFVTLSNACAVRSDTIQVDTNCTTLLEMPNVFTPNSDGINEEFLPIKIQQVKNFSLTIYNRWGIQLFQTSIPNQGWNGNHVDKQCPDGTYFWIVNYESSVGINKSKKGVVHLIR